MSAISGPVSNDVGPDLVYSSPKASERKVARLTSMVFSEDSNIRAAAAGNPMLPTSFLLMLAVDKELVVRSWVARNPACDVRVLEYIARHDSDESLKVFAKHRLGVL